MKLDILNIKNYKCLKDIDSIKFNELTTIIGENDSGKTSIIDFLELMLTKNIPNEYDYGNYPECELNNNIEGIIEFVLSENEIKSLSNYLSSNKKLIIKKIFNKDGSYQMQVKTVVYKDKRLYEYKSMKSKELSDLLGEYNLPDKSNKDDKCKVIKEYLENNEVETEEDWKTVNFNDLKDYLPTIIRYGANDYTNPESLLYKMMKLKFNEILYEKDAVGKKVLKNETLQRIINDIESEINQISQDLLPVAKKINPNIQKIKLESDIDLSNGLKSTPLTIIERGGTPHNLNTFGEGTKKRMCMSIMEWEGNLADDNDNIIKIYDEPDNNLHIEAQRKLFKTIKNSCEKNGQAIICTHSPFIMDVSPIESIRLAQRNDSGITTIDYIKDNNDEDIKSFMKDMCRELGVPNSHIFLEKCFFIVEGESEMNFFPIVYKYLYNSTLLEDGISLINLEGNGAALNFLKLLINNKEDRIVLVVDNDSTHINNRTVMSKLKNVLEQEQADRFYKNNIIYLGNNEFEDCFSNEYISHVLNESKYKKNEGKLWSEDDINNCRGSDKFSDKIKDMVNKYISENGAPENGEDYITKPILGKLLADYIQPEHIPMDIKNVINRIRTVAGIEDK